MDSGLDDGLYAHCTREEHAGNIVANPNPDTYSHLLRGVCRCGEEHGSVVDAAPRKTLGGQSPPSIDTYQDLKLGTSSSLWTYRYASGELACCSARWDMPDGSKEIRPLKLENQRWMLKGIPGPRPLYNLPMLYERPDAPGLVVEGEKTSDAVRDLLPSCIPITSMYGAGAQHLSDWFPPEEP